MMRPKRTDGFTLVEMVVAVAIFSLAVAVCMTTFMSFMQASATASAYSVMHRNLRHALQVMVADIRTAQEVIELPVADDISLSVIEPTGTFTVRYYEQARELHRVRDGVDGVLATGISQLNFDLYQNDGSTTTAARADMVDVRLHTSAEVRALFCSDVLRTRVMLRNKTD